MPGIPIYNKCNNRCIMCTNQNNYGNINSKHFKLPYLLKRIERFSKGQKEFLEDYRDAFSITGGEPTLQPDLIKLMEKINYSFPGIKINLLTNGRMFSYEDYASEILKSGINLELSVSIHGHKAKIHDRITRSKNSFAQTIKGLENLFRFKKSNHLIEIRVVIHKLNYRFLQNITRFIKNSFPKVNRLVFIFFEIEGQAIRNFKIIKLTFTQLLPYLNGLYGLMHSFSDIRFYHFPLCALPKKFLPYAWRTLPSYEVSFVKCCRDCKMKEFCLGIHKGYLKYIGYTEFKPIRNSLNIEKSPNWHHPIKKFKQRQ